MVWESSAGRQQTKKAIQQYVCISLSLSIYIYICTYIYIYIYNINQHITRRYLNCTLNLECTQSKQYQKGDPGEPAGLHAPHLVKYLYEYGLICIYIYIYTSMCTYMYMCIYIYI